MYFRALFRIPSQVVTDGVHIPRSREQLAACLDEVAEVIDESVHLPDWPSPAPLGYVSICHFDLVLGLAFVPVLQELSTNHGDNAIDLRAVCEVGTEDHTRFAKAPRR